MQNNAALSARERKFKELSRLFYAHSAKLKKEGALSLKVKQLISIGIAVVKNCEACVRAHVFQAREAGASDEEVVEACFMSVGMDGGPSFAHTRDFVLKALDDYEKGARWKTPLNLEAGEL